MQTPRAAMPIKVLTRPHRYMTADDELPALTPRQMTVLGACWAVPGFHTVRGLASQLSLPKPVVTRCCDRLVELGYIVRDRDPNDRRSVNIAIRPLGTQRIRARLKE